MVVYGTGVLLLIKRLKPVYPDVTQPCYADDSGSPGMFDKVGLYFNSLNRNVPVWGHCPNPIKIIMIVHPNNLEAGKLLGVSRGFTVFNCTRYLGVYIRVKEYKRNWLKERRRNGRKIFLQSSKWW